MKEKQQFTSSGAAKQESNYWPNSKVYFDGMYWIMESVSKGEDETMKGGTCNDCEYANSTTKDGLFCRRWDAFTKSYQTCGSWQKEKLRNE